MTLKAAFIGPPNTSSGVIEREIQREYNPKIIQPDKEVPELEIDIPDEQLQLAGDQKVFIERIEFKSVTCIPFAELYRKTDCFVNRELTITDIGELLAAIRKVYVSKGYFLARAYAPPQELNNGVLVIEVVEGKLGNIEVAGNSSYSNLFIVNHFRKYQGGAINYDQLMRALLLLNENMNLTVAAVFQKGHSLGTADLILQVEDSRPWRFSLDANNYGSHSTTRTRTGARLDVGNIVAYGDMFKCIQVAGYPLSNLIFTDVNYTIPLNYIGTKLSLGYIYSFFDINRLNFLDLHGWTQIGTVEVSHAAQRKPKLNTDLFLRFDYKDIKNLVRDITNSFDKLRVLSFEVDVDLIDSFCGRNYLDTTVSFGIPNFLGGLQSVDEQCSRNGAGGRFAILNIDYRRIQRLWYNHYLFLSMSAQLTPYKLPSAEQIYIGGIDTVRGYKLAIGLGDNGYYGQFEYRFPLPFFADYKVPFMCRTYREFMQLIAFYDTGAVFLVDGNIPFESRIFLNSTGMGCRFYFPYNLNVNVDAGFPLEHWDDRVAPIFYYKVCWNFPW